MNNLISICIPTFNRPTLLLEAVESCFDQAHRPIEIVIGDDSPDSATAAAVAGICSPDGIHVRYFQNTPSLGQAGNVNKLLACATGPRLMLLHDDDVLVPGGLDRLANAWETVVDVAAVYGKRYIMDEHGDILEGRTIESNLGNRKSKEWEGPQASAIVAAMWQQFPNNGYLIRSDLARQVGYRPREVMGDYVVDHDFGIRFSVAAEPAKFVYIDAFISKWRQTGDSVSSRTAHSDRKIYRLYESLLELNIPQRCRDDCRHVYERLAMQSMRSHIYLRNRRSAFRIYFSDDYAPKRLSFRGLYHFASILVPEVFIWRQNRRARLGRVE